MDRRLFRAIISNYVHDQFGVSGCYSYGYAELDAGQQFTQLINHLTLTGFLWTATYSAMVFIMIALGIARGIRTVYMNVVIPDHVPIDRLAAASGLQMVANGIFLLLFGSIVGMMRDISGSYVSCIVFMNVLTVLTLIMWSVELIYVKIECNKDKLTHN